MRPGAKSEGWVGGPAFCCCYCLCSWFTMFVVVCLCLCSCLLSLPLFSVSVSWPGQGRTGQGKTSEIKSRPGTVHTPESANSTGWEPQPYTEVLCYPFLPVGSSFRDCSRRQQMAGPCWSRWDGMGYGLEQGRQGPRASFLGTKVTPPKFSSTPPRTCRGQLSHLRSSPISC